MNMDIEELLRRMREPKVLDPAKLIETDADQLLRLFDLSKPPLLMIAEISASLAAAMLCIQSPTVFEILPGQHEQIAGFPGLSKNGHVIHVRLDNCPCRTAWVAAHETRHRWQVITGRFSGMQARGESEPDAESFADEFFQRLNLSGRCQSPNHLAVKRSATGQRV